MRIAVYGAGGIGGYFGGRLAQAGEDVHFIARGEHLGALRRSGLAVESVRGDFHLAAVHATDAPAAVGEVDFVLLAVKTWQVADACRVAAPMLGPRTSVVTLQNGVAAPDEAAAVVGRERVVPGIAKIFSFVDGPGRIRHLGGPASLEFAEWDGRPSARVARLREALARAGVTVTVPEDITVALWEKFLFVVPMGGVGAVTRAPIGVTRALPETRALLAAAMAEILAIARAKRVPLADDILVRTLGFVDVQPAAATASLQRDLAEGRPSELEAWNGSVVRLGREAGVATPVNGFIHASLLPLERQARGVVEFPAATVEG